MEKEWNLNLFNKESGAIILAEEEDFTIGKITKTANDSNIQYLEYGFAKNINMIVCFKDGIQYLDEGINQNFRLKDDLAVEFIMDDNQNNYNITSFEYSAIFDAVQDYKKQKHYSLEPLDISLSFHSKFGEENLPSNVYFHQLDKGIEQQKNSDSVEQLVGLKNESDKGFSVVIMIGDCEDGIESHASVLIIDHNNKSLYSFDSGGIHQQNNTRGQEIPLSAVYGKLANCVKPLNYSNMVLQNDWSCTYFATEFAKVISDKNSIDEIVLRDEQGNVLLKPEVFKETVDALINIDECLINKNNCTIFFKDLENKITEYESQSQTQRSTDVLRRERNIDSSIQYVNRGENARHKFTPYYGP